MRRMKRSRVGILVLGALVALGLPIMPALVASSHVPIECTASSYVTRTLDPASTAKIKPGAQPVLRFVNLSDSHILDDESSPVITGNYLEAALDPTIGNGSAQRLQEEFTDEVLDAMVETINFCHGQAALEMMVATGDLVDNVQLNELRRYIDNLDGTSGAPTAYEANCGYLTRDSNEQPKLGMPGTCPAELASVLARPTGRLAADSQANTPDPNDPTYQIVPTRSARQIAETFAASAAGGSHFTAPGLPPSLRCDSSDPGCGNAKLGVPHYAVFGNHDGYVRGTVTMQQPFQAGPAAVGRYFLESQREIINEFFYTTPTPGPVGHGFQLAGSRLADGDDRNDGYYAWDSANGVRMIVLNTIYDGVEDALHGDGATNTATGGHVTGNEVTNPVGLEMGVMDEAQYQWLAAELATANTAGKPILVFSHHPDSSFTEYRLPEPAGDRSAVEVNELLGTHDNVVAWIAGHTHRNVIRPCAPGDCVISGASSANVAHSFWRVETSSLVDFPQEGRIVELFDLGPGKGYGLRLTMVRPDPNDAVANTSRALAEAEDRCTTSAVLAGPMSSGPYDQARLEEVLTNVGEYLQGDFCQGIPTADGGPGDRNVVLLP